MLLLNLLFVSFTLKYDVISFFILLNELTSLWT